MTTASQPQAKVHFARWMPLSILVLGAINFVLAVISYVSIGYLSISLFTGTAFILIGLLIMQAKPLALYEDRLVLRNMFGMTLRKMPRDDLSLEGTAPNRALYMAHRDRRRVVAREGAIVHRRRELSALLDTLGPAPVS